MKKYVADVPRFIAELEAIDQDEAKTYLKDELSKLVDSKYCKIEDITNKKWPGRDEARTSKEKSLRIDIRNMLTISENITKATGATSHISIGNGDIVFNADVCKSLSLTDASATDKDGFFSLGAYLGSLALTAANSVKREA